MRLILLCISILTLPVFSQQSQFSDANKAYAEENYELALEGYSALLAEGYHSVNLYYNLGNTYYRLGDLGRSVWAYEKALKLDPSNEHAKTNLDFIKMQTIDKIDNTAPGIGTWLSGLLFGPSINLWAYLSIAMSILFAISLSWFFRSSNVRAKNLSLLTGAISGVLLLFTLIVSDQHKEFVTNQNKGVVISEEVEIKISPLETATTSFQLHSGTKVKILGNSEGWTHVEVNGNSGWLQTSDVWII